MSKLDMTKKLIHLREEAGYTEKELAGLVGVKEKVVHKWEKGRRLPTRVEINMLSNLYNVSSKEFIVGFESNYKKRIFVQRYKYIALLISLTVLLFIDIPTFYDMEYNSMQGECLEVRDYTFELKKDVYVITATDYHQFGTFNHPMCATLEKTIKIPVDEFIVGTSVTNYVETEFSRVFNQRVLSAEVINDTTVKVQLVFKYEETEVLTTRYVLPEELRN